MTRNEVKAMFQLIRLDRPDFPRHSSRREISALIDLWYEFFGEYDSKIMREAVNNFLRRCPYDPKISDIQAELDKLASVIDDQTIEKYKKEAWSAVTGSKKFGDLSDPLREYFGSQQTIDAIGQDENTIYTVFAAQLERRLPEILARQKAKAEMDPVIESAINQMLKAGRAGQDPEALPGTGI